MTHLKREKFLISGFRREVYVNYTLQGHYAASGGNFLTTFRDSISVPSSGFKNPKGTLKM